MADRRPDLDDPSHVARIYLFRLLWSRDDFREDVSRLDGLWDGAIGAARDALNWSPVRRMFWFRPEAALCFRDKLESIRDLLPLWPENERPDLAPLWELFDRADDVAIKYHIDFVPWDQNPVFFSLEMDRGGLFLYSEIQFVKFPPHKELGIGPIDLFRSASKEETRAELADELEDLIATRYRAQQSGSDDTQPSPLGNLQLDEKYRRWRETDDWVVRVDAAVERFVADMFPKRSMYAKDKTAMIRRDTAIWFAAKIEDKSTAELAEQGDLSLPGGPYDAGWGSRPPETASGIRAAVKRADSLLRPSV